VSAPFVIPDFAPAMPEIVLLVLACVVLLVDVNQPPERRAVTYWMTQVALLITGICVVESYDADTMMTFAGSFKLDALAVVLKLAIVGVSISVLAYSRDYLEARGLMKGEYFLLALFAVLGMFVLVSASSMLTIYLGLELVSLSLYAMVAMDRDSGEASEAAMKFFVLGALASGMLLYGMSMVYGATGSLDIQEIARASAGLAQNKILVLGTVFVVVGIAFKLGAVPFHMWIPDVYQGAPSSVTLFIATAPKLAGFAMLIRLLAEGLGGVHQHWQDMLVLMAVLSMVIGNVVAIAQTNIKRMLAYSTIAHSGFLFLGVIPGTASGYSSALFYSVSYTLTALGAFGLIVVLSRKGFDIEKISDFAGLNQRSPWYALILLVLMLSMAGVPPFVGFWAKWNVLREVISIDMTWLALVAVFFSIIGLFYYLRVIRMAYFEAGEDDSPVTLRRSVRVILSINMLSVVLLGLAPGSLMVLCAQAFSAF
jgi:NADH-quinone oxidoreductase subunit N